MSKTSATSQPTSTDACETSACDLSRPAVSWEPMPEIDLRQLLRMTDDTGMFQHAVYATPDPNHGYCIDDNARALIATLVHSRLRGHDERAIPLNRYLGFLAYAFNDERKRFRNFMAYDRRWLEEVGSQDSQARTLWALGLAVAQAPSEITREHAQTLFLQALPAAEEFHFLRSWAFALMGLCFYLEGWDANGSDLGEEKKSAHQREAEAQRQRVSHLRDRLADDLFQAWAKHASDTWPWWEDDVTYDNAKLSHALLLAGRQMGRPGMVNAGLRSLAWLLQVQTETDDAGQPYLSIIGNDGWLEKNGGRARFDQQPLEAYALLDACLFAAQIEDEPDKQRGWESAAWRCFEWFRGSNDLGLSLYHPDTGGCQDGLQPGGVNKNQGAESILAYLLSVLELHLYRAEQMGQSPVKVTERRSIGLGVLGVSDFAEFALDSYAGVEGLRPTAVWNRTGAKAHHLAEQRGLRAYDELDQMLADPAVDLVYVATTPNMHAEQALAALHAGKHVLCEKPIATDLGDAHEMQAAASRRDRVLAVNFVMRHGPLVDPVRAVIDSGGLGSPLRGTFTNRAGDAGLPADHWFWDTRISGGIFVEHAVHFFDLVNAWLGDASVLCAHQRHRPQTRIVDQVACDLSYGPQTSVNFYHGFTQSEHTDAQDLRLIFERGQLWLGGWIASELEIDAVLANDQIERIESALHNAGCAPQTYTVKQFKDGQSAQRRHRRDPIDRHVRITWSDSRDKQTIYAAATRALMEDTLTTIHSRNHTPHTPHIPRVTADHARTALNLALHANRLANNLTL